MGGNDNGRLLGNIPSRPGSSVLDDEATETAEVNIFALTQRTFDGKKKDSIIFLTSSF